MHHRGAAAMAFLLWAALAAHPRPVPAAPGGAPAPGVRADQAVISVRPVLGVSGFALADDRLEVMRLGLAARRRPPVAWTTDRNTPPGAAASSGERPAEVTYSGTLAIGDVRFELQDVKVQTRAVQNGYQLDDAGEGLEVASFTAAVASSAGGGTGSVNAKIEERRIAGKAGSQATERVLDATLRTADGQSWRLVGRAVTPGGPSLGRSPGSRHEP